MKAKERQIRATTEEWRRLGRDDPLFAVAAHPGRAGSWSDDAFYQLGESDWAAFVSRWRQYDPALGGDVVEIGSGAGRITRQLTDFFDTTTGLEVSVDMIALAERAAPSASLIPVSGVEVPMPDDSVDAVFTCHVLQHLENGEVVQDYLKEAFRVLRPGGTIMAHLLLRSGKDTGVARPLAAEMRLRLVRMRRANRGAFCRVRKYDPDRVRSLFESAGFAQVELHEFRVPSNGGVHAFWFGSSPGERT